MNTYPKVITDFYDNAKGRVRVVQRMDSHFSKIDMERVIVDAMGESSWVRLDKDECEKLMIRALIELDNDKAIVERKLKNALREVKPLSTTVITHPAEDII